MQTNKPIWLVLLDKIQERDCILFPTRIIFKLRWYRWVKAKIPIRMIASITCRTSSSMTTMSSSTRNGSTMRTTTMAPLRGSFRSHSFIKQKVSTRILFVLPRYSSRANPSTEHSSDLVDFLLKSDVLFEVKNFGFLHKTNEKTQCV